MKYHTNNGNHDKEIRIPDPFPNNHGIFKLCDKL